MSIKTLKKFGAMIRDFMAMDKKGQMQFLTDSALGIVLLVVIVAFGISFVADLRAENTSVAEGAALDDGITGLSKITSRTALIASAVVLIAILFILYRVRGRQ